MTRFEYKQKEFFRDNDGDVYIYRPISNSVMPVASIENELNALGSDGWIVQSMTETHRLSPNHDTSKIYFTYLLVRKIKADLQ